MPLSPWVDKSIQPCPACSECCGSWLLFLHDEQRLSKDSRVLFLRLDMLFDRSLHLRHVVSVLEIYRYKKTKEICEKMQKEGEFKEELIRSMDECIEKIGTA